MGGGSMRGPTDCPAVGLIPFWVARWKIIEDNDVGFGFKRGSGTNVEKGTRDRSWREEGYEVLLVSYSHVGLVGFCLVDLGEVVIVVRDSGGTKRRTNFVNLSQEAHGTSTIF
jgi:hypothetical protein